MTRPVKNCVYAVKDIGELQLDDAPFLRVKVPEEYGGGIAPIQNEIYGEEILAVIGDLEFKYQYTTNEWIPLFIYVGDPDRLKEVLDFDLDLDPYADEVGTWVTVKGHPEKQYYHWHDESHICGDYPGSTPIEAPATLVEARDRLKKQSEEVDFIVSERVFNKTSACRGKTVERLKTGLEEKDA